MTHEGIKLIRTEGNGYMVRTCAATAVLRVPDVEDDRDILSTDQIRIF